MENQQSGNQRRQREAAQVWENRRADIERLYVNGTASQADLAVRFGTSQQAVAKALKRMGLSSKARARSGPENGRFKDGTQSTAYRGMVEKNHCVRCGSTDALVVHHKDGVHTNNVLGNLEVLCSPCHSSHHKQEWWDARKASPS